MAGVQESVVENALERFHYREVKQRAKLLREEIDAANRKMNELKVRIGIARKTLCFYASGNYDLGASAKKALDRMTISDCRNLTNTLSKDKAEGCAKITNVR